MQKKPPQQQPQQQPRKPQMQKQNQQGYNPNPQSSYQQPQYRQNPQMRGQQTRIYTNIPVQPTCPTYFSYYFSYSYVRNPTVINMNGSNFRMQGAPPPRKAGIPEMYHQYYLGRLHVNAAP